MSTPTAGVGFSDVSDSQDAGRMAARAALDHAGRRDPPLALVFTTSRHHPAALLQGVRAELGENVDVLGGYSNGVITHDALGYDGYQVGVAAIWGLDHTLFAHEGIAFQEREAGLGLGRQLAAHVGALDDADPFTLLFFLNAVNRTQGRFVMNLGTPFLAGLAEAMGGMPPAVGMRMMGDMKFTPTQQWCGREIYDDAAVAAVLNAPLRLDTVILHGCSPVSAYHTVTAADGPTILEIDGRPALDFVGDILGPEIRDDHDQYKFFVTFGVNRGERWGRFRDQDYVNRMCVRVDAKRRGLSVAEPLAEGTEVQLMRREVDLAYTRDQAAELMQRLADEGRQPVLALYLDCAGRAAAYSEIEEEDGHYLQEGLGGSVPLLGLYGGGEMVRVGGAMETLDWTGVLNVLSV